MNALHRVRKTSVGFNMTPMIDVVFLLIIFFLVSHHLAQREQLHPLELPTAAAGQREATPAAPRFTVSVHADGRIWHDGKWLRRQELMERLMKSPLRAQKGFELRIRCDRSTNYREVEPILRHAGQLGIHRVAFAVVQPADREKRR